jgi:integrase
VRLGQYSRRTEEAHAHWIKRFVRYHGLRRPSALGAGDVERFLAELAERGSLSESSLSQALYRSILRVDVSVGRIPRPKSVSRVPVVLTATRCAGYWAGLQGIPRLVALLLYGSGLRRLEALQLRVKDLDLHVGEIRAARGAESGGWVVRGGGRRRAPRSRGSSVVIKDSRALAALGGEDGTDPVA